jgi:hypothetical protein
MFPGELSSVLQLTVLLLLICSALLVVALVMPV